MTRARTLDAKHKSAKAHAAWDRALMAYLRETGFEAQRIRLQDTTVPLVEKRGCAPEVRVERPTRTSLSVQIIDAGERYYWELETSAGESLFAGEARYVKAVAEDAWLVFRDEANLMHADGRVERLGKVDCQPLFQRIDEWLIGGAGGQAHALNLEHPERSFAFPLRGATRLEATRVGKYLELWRVADGDERTLLIFPTASETPRREAWSDDKLPQDADVRLFDVPHWGAVLVERKVVTDPKLPMGFNFEVNAIQLQTGKRLARQLWPPTESTTPAATLDPRHGLIVVGEGKDVIATSLGSGTSRKLQANEVDGQVERLRVTRDGLLCTDQVQLGRYYSCDLRVTADLVGAGRHRAHNRFCLGNADGVWSGVVAPRRGFVHLGSEGRTVVYGVCGQRLSPDGASAAFMEVKPRTGDDEPFRGALLILVDTRTRRELWSHPLPGETEPRYAFIGSEFSPDGAHIASVFGGQVSVFRTSDGTPLSGSVPAPNLNGVIWLDETTFSGGNSDAPVFSIVGRTLRQAMRVSADAGREMCLFGSLLTPGSVCRSLTRKKP
ncbi:MAG: hypothetical protein H6718_35550 [Polyangiaceae bacterium]|nr:hypothetical protein [Polyangiaceae bacterium]MCB9610389.1 hypothetical protein [Polyangiaceae bacterium]